MFDTATITCPTCGQAQEARATDAGGSLVCARCRRELPVFAELFQGEPSRAGRIALKLLGVISHLLPERDRGEAYRWLLQVVSVEMG